MTEISAVSPIVIKERSLPGESAGSLARRKGHFIGAPVTPGMSDDQVLDAPLSVMNELVEAAGVPVQYADVVAASSSDDGNITLSGEQLIGGVDVVAGERVLLPVQDAPAENGLWVVSAGPWSRPTDFDGAGEAVTGATVQVLEGVQAGLWRLTTQGTITIGTTAQTWRAFSYRSADKVTTKQDGPGASTRPARAKLNDIISVKDFGAVGDGIADDTDAIQAAIDLFSIPHGTPADPSDAGGTIYFPRGIYKVSGLNITNVASTNNGGYNGIKLLGHHAVLLGTPACTKILSIATDTYTTNISGIRVEGFQFDLTAMTATGAHGLYLANAYLCTFTNLSFFGGPTDNTHITMFESGSQCLFSDINASRIKILGSDYGPAQILWTTVTFQRVQWTDLTIDKAWQINFYGCVSQNPVSGSFILSNCDTIFITGGDFEGAGGVYLNCTGGNVSQVISLGNRTSSLTYISGTARTSQFFDRHTTATATVEAGGAIVGTTATEIFNFAGDPLNDSGASRTYAVMNVFGDNGTAGFCDEVMLGFGGVIITRTSTTMYGSPAARTYSFDGETSVKLATASGSYTVKAVTAAAPGG